MYNDTFTNPGTDDESRVAACADACKSKKAPLVGGSWAGFNATGFVVRRNGRCYCESSLSSSCHREPSEWTSEHYSRQCFVQIGSYILLVN